MRAAASVDCQCSARSRTSVQNRPRQMPASAGTAALASLRALGTPSTVHDTVRRSNVRRLGDRRRKTVSVVMVDPIPDNRPRRDADACRLRRRRPGLIRVGARRIAIRRTARCRPEDRAGRSYIDRRQRHRRRRRHKQPHPPTSRRCTASGPRMETVSGDLGLNAKTPSAQTISSSCVERRACIASASIPELRRRSGRATTSLSSRTRCRRRASHGACTPANRRISFSP